MLPTQNVWMTDPETQTDCRVSDVQIACIGSCTCLYLAQQSIAKPATMVIASNGAPLALTATHIYLIFMPFLGSNFLGHAKTAFIKTGQLIMPLESFGELTRWYNQIANLPIAFLLERSLRKHMVSCIFTGLGGNMPNKWPVMTNLCVSQEKTPTQRHMQSLGTGFASPEAECPNAGRTWQVWSPALKAHETSETSKVWLQLSIHQDRTSAYY